jgi:hypothetical protein
LVNTGDRYIDGAERNRYRLLPGFSIIEDLEAGKAIEKGKERVEFRVWLLLADEG